MKYIIFLSVFISYFSFGQTSEIYTSDRSYSYPKYEDKELLKLKTESYILKIKNSGFSVKKNEVTQSKIDIDISIPLDNKNVISFNIVYSFYDSFYSAALYGPKYYLAKNKDWIYLRPDNEKQKAMIDRIEELTYKQYQTEVNSNF